jgi:hypothetical protein
MTPRFHDGSSAIPVRVQITELERRILDGRRSLTGRASTLERAMRRRLSSPTALLLAAGVGFISGRLTERRDSPAKPGVDGRAARGLGLLDITLKGIALVSSVRRAMPSAARGFCARDQAGESLERERAASQIRAARLP